MSKRQWMALIVVGLGMVTIAASLGALPATSGHPQQIDAQVDAIFSTVYQTRFPVPKITPTGPGCAVGVSVDGKVVISKAYGMADLEHDVPITPDTIFDIASVSKQFTAAAVLLLARDGRLSLDDQVRTYIPELPDYGRSLTIRHMLTHPSGLRDWGGIVYFAGWPEGARVYTQAQVLEIARRQRALNFTPGTRISYSNTNYNLAAILVSRVSGQSLAAFARTRIFEPLGMTRTTWPESHTTIVKGRAVAYNARDPQRIRLNMPIDDTYGQTGVLSTVGDLLKWNENFEAPRVGDAVFVADLQTPGRFTDGRTHDYAVGGLVHANYNGLREVRHDGATGGYSSYLARYPEARVSIAVLCNNQTTEESFYAHAIADLFRPARLKPLAPKAATYQLTRAEIDAVTGLYRSRETGEMITFVGDAETLRVEGGGNPAELVDGGWGRGVFIPISASRLLTTRSDWGPSNGSYTWDIDPPGTVRRTDPFGTVDRFERVAPFTPTVAQLGPTSAATRATRRTRGWMSPWRRGRSS